MNPLTLESLKDYANANLSPQQWLIVRQVQLSKSPGISQYRAGVLAKKARSTSWHQVFQRSNNMSLRSRFYFWVMLRLGLWSIYFNSTFGLELPRRMSRCDVDRVMMALMVASVWEENKSSELV